MDRRELVAVSLTGFVVGLLSFLLFSMQKVETVSSRKSAIKNGTTGGTMAPSQDGKIPSVKIQTPESVLHQTLFLEAWNARQAWKIQPGTRVLLVPHNLVTAKEIASLLSSIPSRPSKIFFLSPDHFSQGKTTLTTTDAAFEGLTTFSTFSTIPSLRSDATPFQKEQGVIGLTPFIAKQWPEVPFMPIIIRLDAAQADRDALSAALVDELKKDPQALLISTVDFSHYQPAEVADLHDELALDVIQSLADNEADRVELDSPGALAITLKVARELGLGNVTVHAHTNSLRILKAEIAQDSTSQILASFAPGVVQPQKTLSLFFVGDMMFDRKVADRSKKDLAYPFSFIRGSEDRFFKGMDVVIGNFECPATNKRLPPVKEIDFACNLLVLGIIKKLGFSALSQANNHSLDQGRGEAWESKNNISEAGIAVFGDQVKDDYESSNVTITRRGQEVSLLGFNTSDNPIVWSEAEASIKKLRSQNPSQKIIVFMHWGNEYQAKPSQQQVELAHRFIDTGVDAVIGAHPHWVQSIEVYKNKPIAYSLGNFIFDQDWSVETKFGLTAGLVFKQKQTELHLFPIKIDQSRPQLLTGDARKARLENLASISDSVLSSEIKKGVVVIKE
ncbi:AmmeMemoRadiSam system protein B [Candidatus Uhrbacteria bacterium]|nr:AmmeMemoRadiSam system protein B [Candidatus Uhrbacteria bacterium]